MKKMLIAILIFLGALLPVLAQDGDDLKKEGGRLEALKIAFITKRLNLSPEEAQKFWPVYNRYSEELRKTRLQSRAEREDQITIDEKVLNVRKKYHAEFLKVLSAEKVDAFFKAEKEFGAYLQKEIMERRNQKLQNRRRGAGM
jgi:hypothetical protein